MRVRTAVTLFVVNMVLASGAQAQAARVGRLPVLAPMNAAAMRCRSLPMNAELRRSGMTSGVMATDTAASRIVSLAMTSDGRPKMLMAMMSDSTGPRRRELETVTVMFDANGRVVTGSRSAGTTGVPARLSEDRRAGLLPTDTASARALAAALRRCSRR